MLLCFGDKAKARTDKRKRRRMRGVDKRRREEETVKRTTIRTAAESQNMKLNRRYIDVIGIIIAEIHRIASA